MSLFFASAFVFAFSYHASFSYNDAQKLFFPSSMFVQGRKLALMNKAELEKFSVFASMNDENLSLFFHENHTIYFSLWGRNERKKETFQDLRLWHAHIFETELEAQLYDMTEVEAWFGI